MSPAQRIRQAMDRDKSDNLERAQHAFRGMSAEQLQEQHGQSGKTRGQILAEYERDRHEWQVASDMLDSMIAAIPD